MARQNPYEAVTERILAELASGAVPWRKTWTSGVPMNTYGRPYRGINAVALALTAIARGYKSNLWLTYNQARALGGQVKKGQNQKSGCGGTTVLLWKPTDRKNKATGKQEKGLFCTTFTVFNLDQCEGVTLPKKLQPRDGTHDPIEACQAILDGFDGPKRGRGSPCYLPARDTVLMPDLCDFETPEEYYSTYFHELTHATGHSSRLDRDIGSPAPFGSPDYSREELVAEFGAAFLCAETGIDNVVIKNNAAYIRHWYGKLREDPKLLVQAASAAQKAADLIRGHNPAVAVVEDEAAKAA